MGKNWLKWGPLAAGGGLVPILWLVGLILLATGQDPDLARKILNIALVFTVIFLALGVVGVLITIGKRLFK